MEERKVTITPPVESETLGWVRLPDGSRVPLVNGMTIPAGSTIETTEISPDFTSSVDILSESEKG